jgi:3-dehydroquinate dehydratase-2
MESGMSASDAEARAFPSKKALSMRVLVLHGPNLNLLGERDPATYGTQTLAQIDAMIREDGKAAGIEVRSEQHSGEAAIVDALHAARKQYDGVIINPGAYAHYSYAIADAIASIGLPVVEVHLSNVAARETFRRTSVTAAACRGMISGLGAASYRLALRYLLDVSGK